MESLKRTLNRLRFGNPYGKRHSIVIKSLDDVLPPIPKHLGKLEDRAIEAINQCQGNAFDKLAIIYDFLNEYNQFVQTFSVCASGCAHCCKIDVATTKLEAIYIEKLTGKKVRRSGKHSRKHKTACPFLATNGTWTIYEVRPFNCRTFHTMDDSKFCETQGAAHLTYGAQSQSPPYGSSSYLLMSQILNSLNENGEVKDIRDYF